MAVRNDRQPSSRPAESSEAAGVSEATNPNEVSSRARDGDCRYGKVSCSPAAIARVAATTVGSVGEAVGRCSAALPSHRPESHSYTNLCILYV